MSSCGLPTTRGGLCKRSANPETGKCWHHGGGEMPCGTVAAYLRHLEKGEAPCGECRTEAARDQRERTWRRGKHRPFNPARCGTNSGYEKHLRDGTDPCGGCREAHADAQAAWYRGESLSKRTERVSISDLVCDVLETWDYPMTAEVIAAKVTEIRPEFKFESVRRTVWRLVKEDVLEPVDRLGERFWRLVDDWEDVA